MQWVDFTQRFVLADGGYYITVIEGGKPYVVLITKEQMEVFGKHRSLRVRVKALRALAAAQPESDAGSLI